METELTSTQTVLAVGAAGQFASLVVHALATRGANVRGLVRDAKQSDAVRKGGASDVVVGDLRDRASVDAALKGVDAVFYIAPASLSRTRSRSVRAWSTLPSTLVSAVSSFVGHTCHPRCAGQSCS